MPFAATISIIGSVFFLAGFAALNLGWLNTDSYIYQFANIFGASCFTYTALSPFNTGLFITQFCWALIGVYGMYKIMSINKKRRASDSSDS